MTSALVRERELRSLVMDLDAATEILESIGYRGTNGRADQLGNLLSALSSLNEIPDLLESLRSKLSSTTVGIRVRHGCTPFGSRVLVVVYVVGLVFGHLM